MVENISTTCAVCRLSDGLVMNTIIAAPSDIPPLGCVLIEIMTGQVCNIGWYYANDQFNGPTTYVICDSTTDEVKDIINVSYVGIVPEAPSGTYIQLVPKDSTFSYGWTWSSEENKFNSPVV